MKTLQISKSPDGRIFPIPSSEEIRADFNRIVKKADLFRKQGKQIVVVQGLGYVGSPVATVVANACNESHEPLYCVVGIDLPSPTCYWKVAFMKEGVIPTVSPDTRLSQMTYRAVHETKNLEASVSEEVYCLADIIIIAINLDVKNRLAASPEELEVDLHGLKSSLRLIGQTMRVDALVMIETTIPIGTCEKIAKTILTEERAKRGIKTPVLLAHAYERVMPGPQYVDSVSRYWRSFAGIDAASTSRARRVLESFIDTKNYPLWELQDSTSSELAKLLENSYRATNIAFIYEWTLLAEKLGVNLFEVIDSIRVRRGTHDNIRFPGFGVGGYCLTKDSLLAQWSAIHLFETNVFLRMTLAAMQINYEMPLHTFKLLHELTNNNLSGQTILVCGISYLPDTADSRNSPAELFVDELIRSGANVIAHDPLLNEWPERPKIPWVRDLAEGLKQANGIVFAVPHSLYKGLAPETLLSLISKPPFIVDAQNIISDANAKILHAKGCRLLGVGKGHWRKAGYHLQ